MTPSAWMGPDGFELIRRSGREPRKAGDVPTFVCDARWRAGTLPAPEQPFGIYFFADGVADAAIKDLAGFKHLRSLRVSPSCAD